MKEQRRAEGQHPYNVIALLKQAGSGEGETLSGSGFPSPHCHQALPFQKGAFDVTPV